jgi:HemY protein
MHAGAHGCQRDLMRALLWIVGLFALAVALTVAARYSPGYVLLVLPAHRVEISLNLAVVALALAFVAVYVVLRALGVTLAMPARAAEFRREQQRVRARRAFQEALRAFFEGRFGRAERAVKQALQQNEAVGLSLAVAARSAHELRSFQARDDYLQEMETRAPQDAYLRLMTQAELLLDERRFHDALHALSKLQDKHTAALRLELKAQQQARNWDQVLQLLPQLERRKVFEPVLLDEIKRYAQTENLKRRALDAKTLSDYWDKLPAEDRKDSRVAAAAAQCFIALGGCAQAHGIIEGSLDANWDSALVPLYVECLPRDARRHLERAEDWLQQHPGDPVLLLTLGRLCMQQELWGKARSYLEASLAVEPTHTAYVEFGTLLERIGKPGEASQVYRKGLELALSQLKETTGGRRRVAI